MLYPQNGDHVVTMDSVTSLHRTYTNVAVHTEVGERWSSVRFVWMRCELTFSFICDATAGLAIKCRLCARYRERYCIFVQCIMNNIRWSRATLSRAAPQSAAADCIGHNIASVTSHSTELQPMITNYLDYWHGGRQQCRTYGLLLMATVVI